jgi:hypothetical protein
MTLKNARRWFASIWNRLFGRYSVGGVQVRSIRQIEAYLEKETRPIIDVVLNDGKPPITLIRRIELESCAIQQAAGRGNVGTEGDGIVRLMYGVRGDDDPPAVIFTSADRKINARAAVSELIKAARARYWMVGTQTRAQDSIAFVPHMPAPREYTVVKRSDDTGRCTTPLGKMAREWATRDLAEAPEPLDFFGRIYQGQDE